MKRKIGVILCISLLVSIMCFGNTVAAIESDKSTVTVYGTTYTYWSGIDHYSSGRIRGYTEARASKTVYDSYIGIKVRMYSSTGVLVYSSDWSYDCGIPGHSSLGRQENEYYDPNKTPSYNYYYSKGQVQFYNGDGYTTYTCKATPNITSGLSKSVSVNENGEIYGSELYLNSIGIEPDLISALGENGIVGYVKSEDLDSFSIDNPDEAEYYEANKPLYRAIPLYESDGETKIGEFVVDNDVDVTDN